MSKIAILSDIHSNLPALKAVLAEVGKCGAGRLVIGGDTVGYGAQPKECVDLVRRLGGESVLGNHDHYTLMVSRQPGLVADDSWRDQPVLAGIAHAARQLSAADLGWLAGLEMMIALPGAVLAHASLHGPAEWNYLGGPASALPTLELLRQTEVGLGFFGHTHRQEIFFDQDEAVVPEVLDGRRTRIPLGACCAVLVGSVGQPRDPDDTRASWTTWEPEERIVEFHRTAYPAMEAACSILDAGLPVHSALRLLDVVKRRELLGLALAARRSK